MKRILLCLLAALLCLSLAGCGAKGDTSSVRIVRGASETLEKDEIRAAMDAAMDVFRKTREGEMLLVLRYDEAYSLAWVTANSPEPDEHTLVLLPHKIAIAATARGKAAKDEGGKEGEQVHRKSFWAQK